MSVIPLPESNPRRVSLVESTCSHLGDFIIASNNESEGENWLPSERELAARFGVSRPVIREATNRLELQGLVEIHHGRGTKISYQLQRPFSRSLELCIPDDFARLQQLNETRRILEPETAKLAATHASKSDITALIACNDGLVDCQDDLTKAARFDTRFHQLIATAAGNDVVGLILSSLSDLGEASRRRTIDTTGLDRVITHHSGILKAIVDQNPGQAAKLMFDHVSQASVDLEISDKPEKSSK